MLDTLYLKNCALDMGFNLTDLQTSRLSSYLDFVLEANKHFNLTAITNEKDFVDKHIIDSIVGIDCIPPNTTLCDIGAGAGFPSMPIAIMREDVQVVALDSTEKKMRFVADCARELGVSNLTTVAGRAEEQTKLFGTFDVVTARAVSSLQILLELAMPLLKIGGLFVAYKADVSELALAKTALQKLNAKHVNTKLLSLPNGDNRALLVFQKVGATPAQYPRQYGTIKKKPL